MRSDDGQKPWYPRFVSDRADVLIDELDEGLVQQLQAELQKSTYPAWAQWLEDARADIEEYDSLTAAARKRRLRGSDVPGALKLHHACVFVELWRHRLDSRHMSLPPRGDPLDTPASQRRLLLWALASYSQADPRDFWPFPESPDSVAWPFADETEPAGGPSGSDDHSP